MQRFCCRLQRFCNTCLRALAPHLRYVYCRMRGRHNKNNYFSNRRTAIIMVIMVIMAILVAVAIGYYFNKKVEKLKKGPEAIKPELKNKNPNLDFS